MQTDEEKGLTKSRDDPSFQLSYEFHLLCQKTIACSPSHKSHRKCTYTSRCYSKAITKNEKYFRQICTGKVYHKIRKKQIFIDSIDYSLVSSRVLIKRSIRQLLIICNFYIIWKTHIYIIISVKFGDLS